MRDKLLSAFLVFDADELEGRLMLSSTVFYYTSLAVFICSVMQMYVNTLHVVGMYKSSMQIYAAP